MIDELLSNWWASFKVNSAALSTHCWLSPSLSLVLFQHSITLHLHQSVFFFFSHPLPPIVSISASLSSPVSISLPLLCPISLSLLFFLFPLLSVASSSRHSPFLQPLMVSLHRSLWQLSRSVSLCHSFFFTSSPVFFFFVCPVLVVSLLLGVYLSGS